MSRRVFVILNILFFAFNFLVVEYLPNPILFGWMPLQLFLWLLAAPIGALLWGRIIAVFLPGKRHLTHLMNYIKEE